MVHTSNREEFNPPDGGWGWVVCFTSMICNGTIAGIINTFGILYAHLVNEFGQDDTIVAFRTAWIGAVSTGLTFMTCFVSSFFSSMFGIRQTTFIGCLLGTAGLVSSAFVKQLEILYLTFGVCVGIGSGLMYSPSLVILGHYFRKHLGFVNGIVAFGSALFSTILSIVMPLLLASNGIKFVFLILASMYVVVAVCCLTWREIIPKQVVSSTRCLSFCNKDLFKIRAYVIWVVAATIALIGYFVPFVHLVKHSHDVFPNSNGSWLIMCTQITSGIGRLVFGKIADLTGVNRIRMQQTAFLCMGILTTCIPLSQSYTGLIVICLLLGFTDGAVICLWGPIAFDIVGPHKASRAIGFLLGMFSLPFLLGTPLAGFIYDKMGTYDIAFYAAGAPPILGALIMFLIPKFGQRETHVVQHSNKAYEVQQDFPEKGSEEEKSSKWKRLEKCGIPFLIILLVVIVIVLIVEISRLDHSETPRPGRCPPLTVDTGACIDDCKTDRGCPFDMKCCPTTCGLLKCQFPYTETSTMSTTTVESVTETSSSTVESMTETSSSTVESMTEVSSSTIETMTETSSSTVESMAETSSSTVESMAETSSSTVESMTEASSSTVESMTEASSSTVESMTETSSSTVESMTETSSSTVESMTEASSSTVESVTVDMLTPSFSSTRYHTSSSIQDHISTTTEQLVSLTSITSTPFITHSDSGEYMESTSIMDMHPSTTWSDSIVSSTASVHV